VSPHEQALREALEAFPEGSTSIDGETARVGRYVLQGALAEGAHAMRELMRR